jgi:hypothetical protein
VADVKLLIISTDKLLMLASRLWDIFAESDQVLEKEIILCRRRHINDLRLLYLRWASESSHKPGELGDVPERGLGSRDALDVAVASLSMASVLEDITGPEVLIFHHELPQPAFSLFRTASSPSAWPSASPSLWITIPLISTFLFGFVARDTFGFVVGTSDDNDK